MTDAEISRRLALAIGWKESDMKTSPAGMVLECRGEYGWRIFDYDAPDVIWPIAELFNCFPVCAGSRWFSAVKKDIHPLNRIVLEADTAAKAVALAVIKAKESGK